MSNTSASVELLVANKPDGTVSVFAPGQLPVGVPIANPRKLVVSGNHWVEPPSNNMSTDDFDDWLTGLGTDGYTITDA